MKFHQLPTGARFDYQGATMRKVSPLKASLESDQSQRLLARSAEVHPLDEAPPTQVAGIPSVSPRQLIESALSESVEWYSAALERVDPPLDAAQRSQLLAALAAARALFLARLADPA